ncbi:MAG: cellulase family glycosylhydrolase [Oligoflexia bacterium]|nr:cellulase family glycosylhydrolase [Oligoflexia bacterium]
MKKFFALTVILISYLFAPQIFASGTAKPLMNLEIGVCTHINHGPELEVIKDMGAKWIRIDMNWEYMEPTKDNWEFTLFDKIVKAAKDNGLKIYATLAYAPAWASSNGKSNGIPDAEGWKRFVRVAVERYKNDIPVFGIWNEPNLEGFWVGTSDQYVELLLKPAYTVIKSINENLIVAGPDLAHLYKSNISMGDFFNSIKKLNGRNYLDIIAHHIYAGDDFSKKVNGYSFAGFTYKDGLKQLLEKGGVTDKPVWITEFGIDANVTGELKQTEGISSQLKFMATQSWIKNAFIYELVDDPSIDWQYGLINRNNQPRPVYYEVKKLISSGFR